MADVDVVMQPPRRGQPFRPDIQGLRGLAVGLVVLSHADLVGIPGGFVGVDVFFVLSGFLITGLLLAEAGSGRVSLRGFYARRARRILPAATLVIVVTGIASTIAWNFLRAREVLVDCIWASAFAANIKFAQDGTDYFNHAAVSPLLHFWSLSVEEQFYLVWPALVSVVVFGALRGRSRPVRPAPLPRRRIAAVFAAIAVVSLMWSASRTATDPTNTYFSTFARSYELVAGALVATCIPWLGGMPRWARATLSWSGFTGIIVAAFVFDQTTPFPGTAALLPVVATCALLIGGLASHLEGSGRLLSLKPMRLLGDISYSLYLWHWPVLILGPDLLGLSPGRGQRALLVAVAVLLSVGSYHAVENPLRRPRPSGSRHARGLLLWPVSLAAVLGMVLVGWPATSLPGGAAVHVASANTPSGPEEVHSAVLSARRGDPLPANLTPSIEGLAAAETRIGACSGYRRTESQICQSGDSRGTKTIVLFGNSHATAWVPAVSALAKDAGWQFFPFVKEACHYPGYVTPGVDSQCHQWYEWAKGQIERIDPDLLLMNAYAVGDGWESAQRQAASDLGLLAGRAVMLADVPVSIPGSPIDCLAAKGATMQTCTFPMDPGTVPRDDIQASIAAEAGIGFVTIRDWFCSEGSCPLVIGNRIVYASLGHMSRTYSEHLAPLLGVRLALN